MVARSKTNRSSIPGYGSIHRWVYKTLGKADHCELCDRPASRHEWSNISGNYLRDVNDWRQLCPSCHRSFDYTEEMRANCIAMAQNLRGKPINQLTMDSVFIKRWPSISLASRELGVSLSGIDKAVSGKYTQSGGFKWEVANKREELS